MKPGIHPKYEEATVQCACGNTWQTRSTKPLLRIDLCPQSHPFYTGEQRIVDTAGQVERFMMRLEAASANPRKKKAERRRRKAEQRSRSQRQQQELLVPDAETGPAGADQS